MMIPWLDPAGDGALMWLLIIYMAVLGAVSGSFVGVLVARLPRLESIVRPRSRCDGCGRTVPWYENVPLISFVALGGRCRGCRASIGLRALVLEAACALLFVALAVRLGSPWELLTWVPAVTLLVALTYIDLDHFWLPDVLTAPLALWALIAALFPGRLGLVPALCGLVPAVGLGAFALFYARLAGKEGLGLGDIKLLAALGLYLGARAALALLTLACVQGAVLGSLLLMVRKYTGPAVLQPPPAALADDDWQPDAHAVPFGPFLALATLEAVLCPDWVERGHALLVQLAGQLASLML